jgi:hypothetical protein
MSHPDDEHYVYGTATIKRNWLIPNSWHVGGQKDNPYPYICETLSDASRMAQTVDHYNKTNEIKKFGTDLSILTRTV